MSWKLDIDWLSVDWNKRDVQLAKELGCSIHCLYYHRRKNSTIRHKVPGRTPEPMPDKFKPIINRKGKISAFMTMKYYSVGQKLCKRWIQEWKAKNSVN